jgi:hypothetical protein
MSIFYQMWRQKADIPKTPTITFIRRTATSYEMYDCLLNGVRLGVAQQSTNYKQDIIWHIGQSVEHVRRGSGLIRANTKEEAFNTWLLKNHKNM